MQVLPEWTPPHGIQIFTSRLPPSSNHIYVNRPGGKGRFLSKEAEAWKNRFLQEAVTPNLMQLQLFCQAVEADPTTILELWTICFFPKEDILNTTFGGGTKAAAKTRYKKMDIQNRIKLVADAVTRALGIDDSLNFREIHDKCCADLNGGTTGVCVRLRRVPPTAFGV